MDFIAATFEIMENVHKMGTRIRSFKDNMTTDIQHDEDLFPNHVSTFVLKAQSLTKEARKKQSLSSMPRINQI